MRQIRRSWKIEPNQPHTRTQIHKLFAKSNEHTHTRIYREAANEREIGRACWKWRNTHTKTQNDRSIRTSLRGEYCPIAVLRIVVCTFEKRKNLFIKCNKSNKNDCMIFILCWNGNRNCTNTHERARTKSDLNFESIFPGVHTALVASHTEMVFNFAAHLLRPFAGTSN